MEEAKKKPKQRNHRTRKGREASKEQLNRARKDYSSMMDEAGAEEGSDDSNAQTAGETAEESADQDNNAQAGQVLGGRAQGEVQDEAAQARAQRLNTIVDDPARLWRRKFQYQYNNSKQPVQDEDQIW